MLEFLNNLFASGNQQIPYSMRNPDPENPNSFEYAQEVYNRQIAPWMRPGRQSPMDRTRFEPMPVSAPPQMGMDAAQAAQQQDMLRRYAEANMARAPQSGLTRQPLPGEPSPVPPELQANFPAARTFPVALRQPMPTPEEIPARQSQEGFLDTMFAGGEEPMLSQLMRASTGQDVGVDVGGMQAAPMTREAMGYIPTGIETLIPGANTMGIDFRNVIMNPARKRLSNLLGIQ